MNNRDPLVEFYLRVNPAFELKKLEEIAALFNGQSLQKNQVVFKESQVWDTYNFLEEGIIRSFTSNTEGEEVTTGLFGPGRIVCDLGSLFMRRASRETFVAMSPCRMRSITFSRLQEAFHAMPEFRELGRAILVSEYVLLKERTLAGLHHVAEERYAELIKAAPEVFQHVPLKHIASYLGVTDTSLSRIRKEFSRK